MCIWTADDGALYKAKFADNESLIYLKKGDKISADCVEGEDVALLMKKFSVTARDSEQTE